jgi:hypothetical protein
MFGIVDSGIEIVRSGLIYYIDAARRVSYPGTGASWQDLSTSPASGTIYNTNTYNSGNGGYILFDSLTGKNNYLRTDTDNSKFNIKSGTTILGLTVCAWVYFPIRDFTFQTIFEGIDTTGLSDYTVRGNGTRIQFINFFGNNNISVEANIPDATWCHLALTVPSATQNTNVTVTTYRNGVAQATGIIGLNASTTTVKGQVGRTGNSGTYAYQRMSSLTVYNRQLSATEVLQNFNADRIRFGL